MQSMTEHQRLFKAPPRKYKPRGLDILYEDRDLLVVDKQCGLLTISTATNRNRTAHFLLNEYVKRGHSRSKARVYIVHRIDRETSGILLFAKSEPTKRWLQENWSTFTKCYVALVGGHLPRTSGELISHLTENRAHRVYSVRDTSQGKLARSGYRLIRRSGAFSLVEIELFTGRKHQIRVQFADAGCPVAGDKKYGNASAPARRLMLHAASLSITHPVSHDPMTFTAPIPPGLR